MVRSTDDQGAQPVFVKRFYFRCENMTDINIKSDYKGGGSAMGSMLTLVGHVFFSE